MKLLLDQNLSAAAAEKSDSRPPMTLTSCSGAVSHDRILITRAADFHALLAISGAHRLRSFASESRDCDEALADLIRRVVDKTEDDLRNRSAVTVTAKSIRVHALPLGG